jgi:hypothetical protein
VKLEYQIVGLGKSEHTVLSGLNNGDEFNLGNNRGLRVKILDIANKIVTLKFAQLPKKMMVPGGQKVVQLSVGDTIGPVSLITPAPRCEIKILEIWEEDERKLRYL